MLKNVKGLMLCRMIILSLLLGITFLFQVSEKKYFFVPMTNGFYYFLGLFYFVTILYATLLKRVKNVRRFISLQIIVDQLFITGLVYFTGGKESLFPITYVFSIIGGSIIFYKRGAFFSASLSSLLYGLLLLFHLYRWIEPLGQHAPYDAGQTFHSLVIYMATFYIVAFLSGTISEDLKRKGKELVQKQADYNQLETFNRSVIESLDSGLLTIDPRGKINFLNRTAVKILNRSEEELKNLSIYDLFPKIDLAIEEVKKKTPGTGTDYQRYETLLINHEDRKTHLGFSISPLTDTDGSLIGHTLIFQDITRIKEMEDQMKRSDKMAAVGLLAAGLAHEIRNPLASLSGSIQMLKSDLPLDESQAHLMEITLRESERLNALITDFLLFAQPPQTNRMVWEVQDLIGETIELFTHSPSCHERIRIVPPNPDERIRAAIDPDQIRQVLWNLLINAAQATFDGGEIIFHLGKEKEGHGATPRPYGNQTQGKEWVMISISDSGGGIPAGEREKIFEPFFSTKEGGTGLGLAIVHKIVENHQGVIKVESEMGKGSTFTILLPVDS